MSVFHNGETDIPIKISILFFFVSGFGLARSYAMKKGYLEFYRYLSLPVYLLGVFFQNAELNRIYRTNISEYCFYGCTDASYQQIYSEANMPWIVF